MDDVKYFPYGEKELAYLRKKDKKLSAVIDRVGRHTSMLVQPAGLSMIRMPSGIGCASFAPNSAPLRRLCQKSSFSPHSGQYFGFGPRKFRAFPQLGQ